MQVLKGQLVFSPHDLMAFQSDPLVAWLDRLHFELRRDPSCPFVLDLPREQFKPDEQDEEQQLVARVGLEHEADHARRLSRRLNLRVIADSEGSWRQTLDAMAEGCPAIAGGQLRRGRLAGKPDFLVKSDAASRFGGWSYLPRDAKLARDPRPHHVVQLCAYAWMLEELQGVRPATIEFALGSKQVASLRTDRYFYVFLKLLEETLRFHDEFDPRKPPDVGLARDFGRWRNVAALLLERCDHVRRTAGITLLQVRRLASAGVVTMQQLAQRRAPVPRLEPTTLGRLRQQASLQLRSRDRDVPRFELAPPRRGDPRRGLALLPDPDSADLFFDMEGFPLEEGGLEYLFGVAFRYRGELVFRDWWAHDEDGERSAFEQFIDFVHARWKRHRGLHVYHYAAYEPTALRRLMGKHASREEEVDALLRNRVFVDLYTVVRQGVRIGTPGYSLKDIEPLFAPPRGGTVKTAPGSMVAYQAWRDSGQPADWKRSAILKEIRDYNEFDCRSLLLLRDWLLALKPAGAAPPPVVEPATAKPARTPSRAAVLADEMLRELAAGRVRSPRQRLLAYLLNFHWRELKPVFWQRFEWQGQTDEELADDINCLGGLRRTARPPRDGAHQYAFDPSQDTKLEPGAHCLVAANFRRCTLAKLDLDRGRCVVQLGDNRAPARISLIPDELVEPTKQKAAVLRYVEAWRAGVSLSRAVDDLLDRRQPRVRGASGETLIDQARPLLPQLTDLVARLDRTTLCIQGPPGTGKTYCSGQVIAELLRRGKRVGVTALSHRAIFKALESVVAAMAEKAIDAPVLKVSGWSNADADAEHPLVHDGSIELISSRRAAALVGEAGPLVVGGTSFFFAREELLAALDYLFVDEAGQFSLADCVAVGLSAKNLVLVGDPQQLTQPTQGSHPGESGRSGLGYLLDGRATIPPGLGVLLDRTYRLHPRLCALVSRMTYDDRLTHDKITARREVRPGPRCRYLLRGSGVLFIPVEHVGNTQAAEEEIDVIERLVEELLRSCLVEGGQSRRLRLDDLLLVAPFNLQVSRLRRRLGNAARVGSVDKFQGQEAPVVIVSMCSSTLEDTPRGADFLLSPNRLNVAISRAKCLAVVVASRRLLSPRCATLKQMEQINRLCWIEDHSRAAK